MNTVSIKKHLYTGIRLAVCTIAACLIFSCSSDTDGPAIEEGLKTVNNTDLYTKKIGNGPPVIIVHGGPLLDHSYLLPALSPLAEKHTLLFYDQRLSGRSAGEVDSADISIDAFVEDIEALRTSFSFSEVHLLGHSWGGFLAMQYALRYPENLRSLALLNSLPASYDTWQKEEAVLAQRQTRADSIARLSILQSDMFTSDQPRAIELLLKLAFQKQFANPGLVDSLSFYIPEDYTTRSRQFARLMPELVAYDLSEGLQTLSVRTLVVYGDTEPAAGFSGLEMKHLLPNANLIVLENSGHFPFIEHPEKCREMLAEFWEIR